ncbi:MAG: hypothetical protein GY792_13565 [Gammaproteobacteria bacterium]|nr:hypothetical protein [Gammaproteobacteria bacterium]
MKRFILLLLVSSIPFAGNTKDLFKGEWIDLSHDFSAETIYWPTADTFEKDTVFEGQTDAGFYYTAYNYSAAEHGGTHFDAPIHFAKNRRTIDQIGTHQILFEKNIPGLENVANLDQLPPKGFMIVALPMKIKGGSGGPLRIVAFMPAK